MGDGRAQRARGRNLLTSLNGSEFRVPHSSAGSALSTLCEISSKKPTTPLMHLPPNLHIPPPPISLRRPARGQVQIFHYQTTQDRRRQRAPSSILRRWRARRWLRRATEPVRLATATRSSPKERTIARVLVAAAAYPPMMTRWEMGVGVVRVQVSCGHISVRPRGMVSTARCCPRVQYGSMRVVGAARRVWWEKHGIALAGH